jgi:RNA polymerase sigma-70 factor (ECF subfamily)
VTQTAHDRFSNLYDAHYRAIHGYFVRRLDAPSQAEDLTEDVFLIAWDKLDRVPDGEEAEYWLYGVARRVLANHHRRAATVRRLASRASATATAGGRGPESRAVVDDQAAAVRAALATLRERDREVIRLAYWDDLPHAAIGSILGGSRAAVDVRLHRALRRLGKAIERSGHFSDEELRSWAPEESAC